MAEVWKEIPGFNGYSVSNCGQISHNGKLLKPLIHKNGYAFVNLYGENGMKTKSIHRLVGEAFVPGHSNELNQINHKDGNKTNNLSSNLEWCSCSENNIHKYRMLHYTNHGGKTTSKRVLYDGRLYKSVSHLSREIECSRQNIIQCIKNNNLCLGKEVSYV